MMLPCDVAGHVCASRRRTHRSALRPAPIPPRSFGPRCAGRVGSLQMGSPPQPHGHTVLLVEDDAGTRDAMSAWLMAHDYTVVAARDCLDALTLVQREPRPCI